MISWYYNIIRDYRDQRLMHSGEGPGGVEGGGYQFEWCLDSGRRILWLVLLLGSVCLGHHSLQIDGARGKAVNHPRPSV